MYEDVIFIILFLHISRMLLSRVVERDAASSFVAARNLLLFAAVLFLFFAVDYIITLPPPTTRTPLSICICITSSSRSPHHTPRSSILLLTNFASLEITVATSQRAHHSSFFLFRASMRYRYDLRCDAYPFLVG
jgi:hypothetical protein